MADVKVPIMFGVSSAATARARANADPNLYAPEGAKKTVSRDGKTFTRWTETGTVDQVWAEMTKGDAKKPKLTVFVVGVRMRPGEPNQNKIGWFRLMVHPEIAAGRPVSQQVKDSYEMMTERNLAALVSLLDVTGKMPASGDLSPELLNVLFPAKDAKGKSKLLGATVTVKIVQSPNEGGSRDVQEVAEVFLPPKAVGDGVIAPEAAKPKVSL